MNDSAKTLNVHGRFEGRATTGWVRYVVMVQKEVLELARSYKLLWVPLVFILLGMMQPVSTYYMPVILERAGSLPEGTVIDIPMPQGAEVLAQTLQQFGTLGVLVLVLAFMGTVSGERMSGVAAIIMVKPISPLAYIGSKWTAMLLLTWGSLTAGYLGSWYYTGLLIGEVPLIDVCRSLFVYGLWLSMVMVIALLLSTWLRSPAAAAFATFGGALVLTLLAHLFPAFLGWTPGSLSGYAYQLAASSMEDSKMLGYAVASTLVGAGVCISLSAALLSKSSTDE
ncbi:ABC transporter permease [Paenibacillus sinopodophylli]|uniref:ABC transporter permease n=1 Tax=Paenibacillus sinopodophylli TaxID=1837342 RepID=UPI00110C95BA|nr:ABC transporter permease subunit [Paenibacillus sinopodophylli]